MKQRYTEAELEIVQFSAEDVIVTSGPTIDDYGTEIQQ